MSAAPNRLSPSTLLALPDELLCRIFALVQHDEPARFGRPPDQHNLSSPFPALAPYRAISKRLHHRIVVDQARRTLIIPPAVAVPAGAAWDADVDPRIANIVREGEAAVASLVLALPPGRLPPWSANFFARLVHLGELSITGGIVITPGLGLALRALKSLRKLSLHIDPDETRKVVDQAWTISLGRDAPSLAHLDISFVTIPSARHTLGIWSMDGARQLRFLAIEAVVGPSVDWKVLEVLVLRAASTSAPSAGEWLAEILKDVSEIPVRLPRSPVLLVFRRLTPLPPRSSASLALSASKSSSSTSPTPSSICARARTASTASSTASSTPRASRRSRSASRPRFGATPPTSTRWRRRSRASCSSRRRRRAMTVRCVSLSPFPAL